MAKAGEAAKISKTAIMYFFIECPFVGADPCVGPNIYVNKFRFLAPLKIPPSLTPRPPLGEGQGVRAKGRTA